MRPAPPAPSVGRAAHTGSPGGIHNIFVAVLAVRARPQARRRVPRPAQARPDLILVLAEGEAPARPQWHFPGVTRIDHSAEVVRSIDVQIGRGLEAES